MTGQQLKIKLTGWFDTSFWVDVHYGLAALGTLIVFGKSAMGSPTDAGFVAFVASMWVTAVGNDAANMPKV